MPPPSRATPNKASARQQCQVRDGSEAYVHYSQQSRNDSAVGAEGEGKIADPQQPAEAAELRRHGRASIVGRRLVPEQAHELTTPAAPSCRPRQLRVKRPSFMESSPSRQSALHRAAVSLRVRPTQEVKVDKETLKKTIAAVALLSLATVPVVAWATSNSNPTPFAHRGHPQTGTPMGQMQGMGAIMSGMEVVESEFDYLAGMIPHHEEAIASAQVLLDGTDRPEMKTFAEKIIETQSAEVGQMQEWLAAWYPEQDISVDYEPMMRNLDSLTGDELDQAFLEDMIHHHGMAVMMSQQLLTQGLADHPEVVPFAEQIRDDQHAEIFQMSGWLREWFGVTSMGAMGARR